MTSNFTITDTELAAIRAVEQFVYKKMEEGSFDPPIPVQTDVAVMSRLFNRLAYSPPIEEVASRPNNPATSDPDTEDLKAGSSIGIVRDHPSHDEDESTAQLILRSLLPLANLPPTVDDLVWNALQKENPELRAAVIPALDAIGRKRHPDPEIPF